VPDFALLDLGWAYMIMAVSEAGQDWMRHRYRDKDYMLILGNDALRNFVEATANSNLTIDGVVANVLYWPYQQGGGEDGP